MATVLDQAIGSVLPLLSMTERGELLTAISSYRLTGEVSAFESAAAAASFAVIKVVLDNPNIDNAPKKRGNPNFIKKPKETKIAILRNSTQLSPIHENCNNCTEVPETAILENSENTENDENGILRNSTQLFGIGANCDELEGIGNREKEDAPFSLSLSPTPPNSDSLFPEDKEIEKEIEEESSIKKKPKTKANLEERRREFEDKVWKYSDRYPPEVIERFISYWGECNEDGRLMAWEKERTFEIGRRLTRFGQPLGRVQVNGSSFKPASKVEANIQAVIDAERIIRERYG